MPEVFATLVGTHFRGHEAKIIAAGIVKGDQYVELRPEPHNQYDAFAVACYVNDEHVGYLSRDNNHAVSAALQDGVAVTTEVVDFQGQKPILLLRW